MKTYYAKAMRALQLAGMSTSTQESYTRSIRQVVDFYKKAPDLITETELEGILFKFRGSQYVSRINPFFNRQNST